MGYVIKPVSVHSGQLRVAIPLSMIEEKGWENVRYVKISNDWGNRIVITRVADHEEDQKEDN